MFRGSHLAVTVLAAAALVLPPAYAGASCGADNCPLDTHAALRDGRFGLDVSLQYIDQDRLRIGSHRAAVGELPSPEDEVRTTSRMVTATARGQLARRLGVTLALPYVDRAHEHIRNTEGAPPEPMDFRYAGLGDLVLTGQWMALGADASGGSLALMAGVKLPTGRRDVTAIDGERPEPPARPGTGSTDGLIGLHAMRPFQVRGVSLPLFASVQARMNGRGTEDYRVGDELQVSTGGSCPVGDRVELLGQLNLRVRGKDDVGRTDAQRDNTGGTWLFASPGLRIHTGPVLAVYGYLQVPVYEHLNRIQLDAPVHLMIGTSYALGR